MLAKLIAKLGPVASLGAGMLSRASSQIVALLITLIAARYLTPGDFGVYAIAAALVTIIRTLIYSATFQYVMQTPDLKRYSSECLAVSLVMTAICSALPVLILLVFPNLFGGGGVLWLFVWMAPSNLIAAFTAWSEAQVLRSGKIARYYAVTSVTEFLSGGVAAILFVAGFGVMSLVPMAYVRAIVLAGCYVWILCPVLSSAFSASRFVEVGRWSLPQYASSLTGLFSNYGADFIIGAILSPAATGLYRAASRITGAVSDLCAQPVRLIATTVFARRRAAGGHASDLWPAVAALSLFIALPALGGLAAVADLILPRLFGPAWANLAAIVAVLSLGRVFASMAGVATPFLVAHGQHRILLPVQLVSAACLLIGLVVFSRQGVQATAIVTAVSVSVGALAYLGMAYRTAGSPPAASARLMLVAAIPGLVSTFAAGALSRTTLVPDPILLAIIAVAVAVGLWLVAVLVLRRGLTPILHPLRADAASVSTPEADVTVLEVKAR